MYEAFDPQQRERLWRAVQYLYPSAERARDRARVINAVAIEELMSLLDMSQRLSERLPSSRLSAYDVEVLRDDLLRGIAHLLIAQQRNAERQAMRGRLEYALRFVARLQPEDTVVTFNWDPLLERCLVLNGLRADLRGLAPNPQRRTVLKLHGSVDWYRVDEVLERVDREPVYRQVCQVTWDHLTRGTSPVRGNAAPFVLPPTFFKDFQESADLEELWIKAAERLERADEIHFLGYRLPAEDLFARAMLRRALRANALRPGRLRGNGPVVTVVNPDRGVAGYFRRTLHHAVQGVARRVEESEWTNN